MYTYGLCIRRSISPTRNIIVNETYGERRRSKSKTYGDRRAYFSFHAIRKIDAFSFRSGSGATKIKSGKVFKPPSLLYGKSTNGEIISARTRPDYPRFDGYLPLVLAGREEEIIFRVEYVSRASVSRSRIHRAHLPPPKRFLSIYKNNMDDPGGSTTNVVRRPGRVERSATTAFSSFRIHHRDRFAKYCFYLSRLKLR